MQQFKNKIRLIFLPFLYIAFAVIGICTFLHWLLFINYQGFKVNDMVINFWVPIILPGIPLLIWLRPRLKLLILNNTGRRDPLAVYIMLAWFTIAISTAIAQSYIVTATGKLTPLNNIAQIKDLPATMYYTVNRFYINKRFSHAKAFFSTSGKYNQDFDMSIFVAVPVFDHLFPDTNKITQIREGVNPNTLIVINDTLSTMRQLKRLPADSIRMMRYVNPSIVMPKYGDAGKFGAILVLTHGFKTKIKNPDIKIEPIAWLAVKYTKTISNHLSNDSKQYEFKRFERESDTDFRFKRLAEFEYLERPPYNSDLRHYVAAVKSRDDVIGGEPIILLPIYENFADRNGNKLAWIFGALGIGSAIFVFCLIFAKLKANTLGNSITDHQQILDELNARPNKPLSE